MCSQRDKTQCDGESVADEEEVSKRQTKNPIFVEGWWISPSILLGLLSGVMIGSLVVDWLFG